MGVSGRILIIDDDLALRQTMARILQQAGFEVITAGNAAEGLVFDEAVVGDASDHHADFVEMRRNHDVRRLRRMFEDGYQ